jgi:uncharacterized protein YaiE (UPF0345 family)
VSWRSQWKEIVVDHAVQPRRRLRTATLALGIGLVVAACSGAATPGTSQGSAPASGNGGAAASAPAASGDPGSVAEGVTGSLETSGLYDATWTWEEGNDWGIGDLGTITLNSDKGTFASIGVHADGSITFSSGAPELASGSYAGSGAQVTLGSSDIKYVCAFTLDNDLTGSDGTLHIAGSLALHSNDEITPC